MNDRIRLVHEGVEYDPFDPYDGWFEPDLQDPVTPEEQEARLEAVRDGTFIHPDGAPLADLEARRARARLLGTFDAMPKPGEWTPSDMVKRWVIPGLWPVGAIPMLGGNPKAGKSTLVVDLLASVLEPKRRFLDHFGPTEITDEERWDRGVWLINAENPPDALIEELVVAGIDGWIGNGLTVEHLEQLGGPRSFDLRDPDVYAWWEFRLIHCDVCNGTDDWMPIVVIVDGLTAILGGTTEGYGEWYAAFRRLMRSLDVPNAIVVAHSTLKGDHLMGGTEAQAGSDGNWNLERRGRKRLFSVQARMGGESIDPTEVRLDPDGRLRLIVRSRGSATPLGAYVAPTDATGESLGPVIEENVFLHVVLEHGLGHQPSGNDIRRGVHGRNPDVDAALAALVKSGRVERYPRSLRGGGFAYRPASPS